VGTTACFAVALKTPAKDAYQAAIAVARPSQPPTRVHPVAPL
jgi:hypothetical protein